MQINIIDALKAGSYKTVAASYAGVDRSSIYHWLERGEADVEQGVESEFADFFHMVQKAEADHEITALLLIAKAARDGGGNWQAMAWLLERKHPDRWGRRLRVDTLTRDEVLYSMASSSGEDIPRGLEFLLSRNRLNVAVSRAQCLAYLVCSPRLLDVNCRTIEQMRLANALCRFIEFADHR